MYPMTFELYRKPIIPANPAGLSTDELRRYLNVGRNNVSAVAHRFGIEKLHGIYPEVIVWRQLFGLSADDDIATSALREPLADINWVSRATGVPQSTVRDHLRSKQWQYDGGVQLGEVSETQKPRLRRWIPALIRSRRLASPAPAFSRITPIPVNAGNEKKQTVFLTGTDETQPDEDLFAALLEPSEPTARQRRE
jgi:hypothetical protein